MGMSAHAMEIKPGGIDYSSRIFMNLGAITIGKPFGARHLKEGDRNTYDRVMGMDQLAIGTPQKERKLSFSGVMRSLGFSQG